MPPLLSALAALLLLPFAALAETADKPQAALRLLATPGHFALIRHATAPGGGDPAGFRLDDCSTQRNLSDAGREEARALGRALRSAGIASARVRSSQWCRCLETARLIDVGAVEPWPLINSFFGTPERGPAQTAALADALKTYDLATPLILVTHHTVVIGLVGTAPASGEIVIVRRAPDGTLAVAGRVPPPR
jgi:phosphohistidine phosphatase SixA